jgi:hypothetical protein
MEDYSVYGSDEEADDPRDAETDDDLTDEERDMHEVWTIYLSVRHFFPLLSSFTTSIHCKFEDNAECSLAHHRMLADRCRLCRRALNQVG